MDSIAPRIPLGWNDARGPRKICPVCVFRRLDGSAVPIAYCGTKLVISVLSVIMLLGNNGNRNRKGNLKVAHITIVCMYTVARWPGFRDCSGSHKPISYGVVCYGMVWYGMLWYL